MALRGCEGRNPLHHRSEEHHYHYHHPQPPPRCHTDPPHHHLSSFRPPYLLPSLRTPMKTSPRTPCDLVLLTYLWRRRGRPRKSGGGWVRGRAGAVCCLAGVRGK
ncbi:hypothetical protein E2C01_073459 [Portunus trituberculatus]|uniref:Uncharacterized protein n=1 Tax=Portunus trituberculatus TaxID=210409 RepID=A0A5B7I310_PORTR|nr:hypothetical protein [Portunus trituberculatus]